MYNIARIIFFICFCLTIAATAAEPKPRLIISFDFRTCETLASMEVIDVH